MKLISGIIGISAPVLAMVLFFINNDVKIISYKIMRDIVFYSICAGFSGIMYYASGKNDRLGIVLFYGSIYFAYLFFCYGISDIVFYLSEHKIFNPDLPFVKYKWILISTGGIFICTILGLSFRQNSH